ncbi:MAG TPA: hypothetical protein VGR31_12495 [Planctomycetota bacterium]|nr:hypothetical protein [Planctomycetota bacterium]
MIRYLRAFAWLRWRLLINGFKGSKRRDVLERLSRLASVLAPALLIVPFGAAAALLAVLGFHAGRHFGTGGNEARAALLVARLVLFLVIALPVLVPLGRASQGTKAGAARLLLLPIPRRALHLAEAVSALADPWLAFVVPGLVLFAAGLLSAGRIEDGVVAFAAALALIAAVVSLSALASFASEWIMRDRRRGEVFTLVFVLLISMVGLMPAFLVTRHAEPTGDVRSVDVPLGNLPAWTQVLPSELYARALQREVEGHPESAWLLVGILAAEAAAIYAASSAVHGRLLAASGNERAHRRRTIVDGASRRWPFLTPEASAVAVVHARNALRSVRGRLAVLLPGPLIAGLALLSRRLPGEVPFGSMLNSQSHVLLGFGCVFSLYALQAFHLNQFASDRAGLSLHFLSPVSDVDLVRGKAAGGFLIYAVSIALCFACAWVVTPGGPTLTWFFVLVAGTATYALLAPIAAVLSTLFPKTADLSQTGQGGNPHGLAVLIGSVTVMVLGAPAGLVLTIVHDRMHEPGLAAALILGWAVFCIAVAFPLCTLAAQLVKSRRENLALVAGGR